MTPTTNQPNDALRALAQLHALAAIDDALGRPRPSTDQPACAGERDAGGSDDVRQR